MKDLVSRAVRPIQCAGAMIGRGVFGVLDSAIFGSAERWTARALHALGHVREHLMGHEGLPEIVYVGPKPSALDVQAPAKRDRRDTVDEASWESFPASDPPSF